MDRCGQCGKELSPEYCDMQRIPCPDCGSAVRSFTREVYEHMQITDSVSWKQTRPGVQSAAQLDDQGNITLTATGPSPTNEEDALEICIRLVRVFNSMAGNWSDPVEGEHDVDCYSANGSGDTLLFQVIRASNNGRMWQELNDAGATTVALDADKAAAEMIAAIRKKSAKYSPAQKKAMTLVLDAGRTPGHTFAPVFDAFRKQYLEDCRRAGFAQVWAVGPHDGLVIRLDQ